MASVNNNLEIVEKLIAAKADVNVRDKVCQPNYLFRPRFECHFSWSNYSKEGVRHIGPASKDITKYSGAYSNRELTPIYGMKMARQVR